MGWKCGASAVPETPNFLKTNIRTNQSTEGGEEIGPVGEKEGKKNLNQQDSGMYPIEIVAA